MIGWIALGVVVLVVIVAAIAVNRARAGQRRAEEAVAEDARAVASEKARGAQTALDASEAEGRLAESKVVDERRTEVAGIVAEVEDLPAEERAARLAILFGTKGPDDA